MREQVVESIHLLWRGAFALAALCVLAPAVRAAETKTLPLETFRDKLRGGWAGQMIGVSYGSIYEFQSNGRPILGPLRVWKPEFVENSLQQDDIYVEMTFLRTLERYGPKATRRQAGEYFRDSKYRLWHANMAARENLRQGIFPPQSGHPRYNPHADDIDFQIEADIFGLIAPGLFRASNTMCDVFGSVMNYGDGLYGGRFVAGMYAQAYLETGAAPANVRRCLEAGMGCLPKESGYYKILCDVIAGFERNPDDWQKTWREIEEKWGRMDTCPDGRSTDFNIDAKLNGAYIALGLLYGQADMARTLEITTRCGQDADCNPSNAAGVLGALSGFKSIPKEYTNGIPALTGQKFEYTEYDYPALIAACERVALRVVKENGGQVLERDGATVLELPVQLPEPPRKLEQMQMFPAEKLKVWEADFNSRLAKARMAAISLREWGGGLNWKLVACGNEMDPGIRQEVFGRVGVLVTHPVDRNTPAVLETEVDVPENGMTLEFDVASHNTETADWVLNVRVDGKPFVSADVRTAEGSWYHIKLDLTPVAGKRVRLRLENAPGGTNPWAWEAAYWSPIRVVRR